jgi:hypothetical protein
MGFQSAKSESSAVKRSAPERVNPLLDRVNSLGKLCRRLPERVNRLLEPANARSSAVITCSSLPVVTSAFDAVIVVESNYAHAITLENSARADNSTRPLFMPTPDRISRQNLDRTRLPHRHKGRSHLGKLKDSADLILQHD